MWGQIEGMAAAFRPSAYVQIHPAAYLFREATKTDITDCLKPKGEQSHDRIQKERDLQGIRKMHTELPFQ